MLLVDLNLSKCTCQRIVKSVRVAPQRAIEQSGIIERLGGQREGAVVEALEVMHERDGRRHNARVLGAVQTVSGGLRPIGVAARRARVQQRHLMDAGKGDVRRQRNHLRAHARLMHVALARRLPERRERRARRQVRVQRSQVARRCVQREQRGVRRRRRERRDRVRERRLYAPPARSADGAARVSRFATARAVNERHVGAAGVERVPEQVFGGGSEAEEAVGERGPRAHVAVRHDELVEVGVHHVAVAVHRAEQAVRERRVLQRVRVCDRRTRPHVEQR